MVSKIAKVGIGSGQGRMRQYKGGIMVRCANFPCVKVMRYIDLTRSTTNTTPPWKCDGCRSGRPAIIVKEGNARVGQQKQKR